MLLGFGFHKSNLSISCLNSDRALELWHKSLENGGIDLKADDLHFWGLVGNKGNIVYRLYRDYIP